MSDFRFVKADKYGDLKLPNIVVTPNEVIPFAALCLNYWPYRTADRILPHIKMSFLHAASMKTADKLALRHLVRVLYQPTVPNAPYLLDLEDAKPLSLLDKLTNAGNLFFFKRDIVDIEQEHKDYRSVPPGAARRNDSEYCTTKNFLSIMAHTLFKIHTGEEPTAEEEKHLIIPPERAYTWLGPIAPEIPDGKTFQPSIEEKIEIATFVELGRGLGQNENKYLAKMVKCRFPNLSNTELVDFIMPKNKKSDKAKDSQAHRWGIIGEKRREIEQ